MNEMLSRYGQSAKRLPDLFRFGGTHIFLPVKGYDGIKVRRQWLPQHADLFYAAMPDPYSALFVRAWNKTTQSLAGLSPGAVRFQAKLFIGSYILSCARLTGRDVRSTCRMFLESGFDALVAHPEIKDHFQRLLWYAGFERIETFDGVIADGHPFPLPQERKYRFYCRINRRPGHWRFPSGSHLLSAEQLRKWCFEADVPDCRIAQSACADMADACVSLARFADAGWPQSRIYMRRWLPKQDPATVTSWMAVSLNRVQDEHNLGEKTIPGYLEAYRLLSLAR